MKFLKKLTQTLLKPFLQEVLPAAKKKKSPSPKTPEKAKAKPAKAKPVKKAKAPAKKAQKSGSEARNIKRKPAVGKGLKPLKRGQKAPQKKGSAKGRGAGQPQSPPPAIPGTLIGHVTHFFPQVNVAALRIEVGKLEVGNELYFKGATTDFKTKIQSMQINRVPVTAAGKGSEIGILVKKRVREGDEVYKLS